MKPSETLYELNKAATENKIRGGLIERIAKARALANVATSEDFLENFDKDIQNYLWALRDILNEVDELISLWALNIEIPTN